MAASRAGWSAISAVSTAGPKTKVSTANSAPAIIAGSAVSRQARRNSVSDLRPKARPASASATKAKASSTKAQISMICWRIWLPASGATPCLAPALTNQVKPKISAQVRIIRLMLTSNRRRMAARSTSADGRSAPSTQPPRLRTARATNTSPTAKLSQSAIAVALPTPAGPRCRPSTNHTSSPMLVRLKMTVIASVAPVRLTPISQPVSANTASAPGRAQRPRRQIGGALDVDRGLALHDGEAECWRSARASRATASPSTTAMHQGAHQDALRLALLAHAGRLRHQPGRAHAQEIEAPQEDADDRPAERHAAEIGGVAGEAEHEGIGGAGQRHRGIGEDQRPGAAQDLEAREGFGCHRLALARGGTAGKRPGMRSEWGMGAVNE